MIAESISWRKWAQLLFREEGKIAWELILCGSSRNIIEHKVYAAIQRFRQGENK